MAMQQLRSKGSSLLGTLVAPQLKRKALKSWAAVQDTYFSTKDIFESHKVVFTIGTSIASVGTAWVGYSIRHHHETKVDRRLESIEKAMKSDYHLEHSDLKKLVDPGSSSTAAWIATAGTTFIIGYGFGWRGGRWYANRQFRKEQMKLLGQIKPRGWQLLGRIKPKEWQLLGRIKPRGWQFQFLRRSLMRTRVAENAVKSSETSGRKSSEMMLKDAPTTLNSG